jgi:hypothetical protein
VFAAAMDAISWLRKRWDIKALEREYKRMISLRKAEVESSSKEA